MSLFSSQLTWSQQFTTANMLWKLQEMGSHALDIYNYLLAGMGRQLPLKVEKCSVFRYLFPEDVALCSRSTDKGLPIDAESCSHVCNTIGLPVFRTVCGTSHYGQPETLPAEGAHDSLQFLPGGSISLHCV